MYYPNDYDWYGPYFNPFQVTARCSVNDSSSKVKIMKAIFETNMTYHYLDTGKQVSNTIVNKKSVLSRLNPNTDYTYVGNALAIPNDIAFLLTGNGVDTGTVIGYSLTVTKDGENTLYEYTTDEEFSY